MADSQEFLEGVLQGLGPKLRRELGADELRAKLGMGVETGLEALAVSLGTSGNAGDRAEAEAGLSRFLADPDTPSACGQALRGRNQDLEDLLAVHLEARALASLAAKAEPAEIFRQAFHLAVASDSSFSVLASPERQEEKGLPSALSTVLHSLVASSQDQDKGKGTGQELSADAMWAHNLVQGLQLNITQHHYPPQPPPGPDKVEKITPLSSYLKALATRSRHLPLGSLGGKDQHEEELSLEDVFIELDTTTMEKFREEAQKPNEKGEMGIRPKEVNVSAEEAFSRHPLVVIVGGPGSGKSSLAKELIARQAEAMLGVGENPPSVSPKLVPVLVELRKLAPMLRPIHEMEQGPGKQRALQEALLGYILDDLEKNGCAESRSDLKEAFETGNCFMALDGLDEVAGDLRGVVRQAVRAGLQRYPLEKVLVTCRTRSYTGEAEIPEFERYELAPLQAEKIRRFCAAWYQPQKAHIGQQETKKAIANLVSAAMSKDLLPLAQNPMLLTTMALVHQQSHELPDEKTCLYYQAVETLALRWQKHKGQETANEELTSKLKEGATLWSILERLGYEAHQIRDVSRQKAGGGELSEEFLLGLLKHPHYLGSADLAEQFLHYVDQRAGLLVGEGGAPGENLSYRFAHQTFQEYLAGRYLNSLPNRVATFREHAAKSDFWNLPVLLAAEDLHYQRQEKHHLLDLAYRLNPSRQKKTRAFRRGVLWSAMMALEVGTDRIEADGETGYLKRLRRRLKGLVTSNLSDGERVEAGRLLGRLGPKWGDNDPAVMSLPGLELCFVPPGPFFFGPSPQEEKATRNKDSGGEVALPWSYWIGRFPVTQAQFGEFVERGGYRDPRWWPEAQNLGYWKEGRFKGRWEKDEREGPLLLGEPFDLGNHPVVGVSWYESLAFCRWLTEEARSKRWIEEPWAFTLPSEVEWEKAARGGLKLPASPVTKEISSLTGGAWDAKLSRANAEPRQFPWGHESTHGRANLAGAHEGTSRPGCFEKGRGPYGSQDLSGNVFEWSRSPYLGNRDISAASGSPEKLEAQELEKEGAFLKGGSFQSNSNFARCSARGRGGPGSHLRDFGFRLVLLPFSLDSVPSEP